MQFNTDYYLENYILNTKWEDFPEEIKQRAIVCGIDLTIALLLGSKGNQFKAGLLVAKTNYKEGIIPIIGNEYKFGLLGATVAMSHASNSFDIDDGHNMIKGHPGTSFVAGILAAALEKNLSYKEYLTTLVIAYETAIRSGLAIQDHYNYLHSTGTYGAFGTATGIGRIYKLSKEQLNNALSIAEFHAPLTPVMRSVNYPSMNKDGVPFGALVGAVAVSETLAGSTGYGNLLETPEYRYLLDSLGKKYEILNLYFKPYTCCRWAHQPIKACITLMHEHNFTYKEVAKVTIHTFDAAAQLSKKIPTTTDEAQYNIAWPVASALVHGDVGYMQVCEEALDNQEVINMMERLEFIMDPKMNEQFPSKRLAWVEIKLDSEKTIRSDVFAAPGEHTDNIDLNWITEKFMRITKPVLKGEQQIELLQKLQSGLEIPVRDFVTYINHYTANS